MRDLPNGLVDRLELGGDRGDVLDRTTSSNNEVLHLVVPKAEVDEITQQPWAYNLEVSRQDSSSVEHGCVRLEATLSARELPKTDIYSPLVPSQDLRGGSSRHRCDKERVPDTVLSDAGPQSSPVPEISRDSTPQVELKFTLRNGRSFISLVFAKFLSHLTRSLESSVVDGLEDLNVEFPGGRRVERHSKSHKGVGETLDTETDGSVSHVAVSCLDDGVVVSGNDLWVSIGTCTREG